MKYLSKSFTVPANDSKPRPDCKHGWIARNGRCTLCGKKPDKVKETIDKSDANS